MTHLAINKTAVSIPLPRLLKPLFCCVSDWFTLAYGGEMQVLVLGCFCFEHGHSISGASTQDLLLEFLFCVACCLRNLVERCRAYSLSCRSFKYNKTITPKWQGHRDCAPGGLGCLTKKTMVKEGKSQPDALNVFSWVSTTEGESTLVECISLLSLASRRSGSTGQGGGNWGCDSVLPVPSERMEMSLSGPTACVLL